jgi:hypothetical protein
MKSSLPIALMIALAVAASAQQTEPVEPPAGEPASAPATLVGQRVPREPLTGRTTPNYVAGGIAITQMFTDNAELATSDRISNLSYSIQPQVALNHTTPRFSYSLGALFGFVVNQNLEEQNQATQAVSLDLSYGLTRFTTLRLSDSFMNTTGLWSGPSAGTSPGPGIGAVQQPNSALVTYGAFRTNDVLVELSHQFTINGNGGIRATQSFTWFPETATSPVLGMLHGGHAYSAEAFYNHRFSLRHWAGVTARAQRFDLDRSLGRTDTASFVFLYGFNIRPNVSISLFAGPELSMTSVGQGISAPVFSFPRRLWSPATGAVFSWQHQRTGVTASFVRQVSNGGGLASAVTLSSVDAELVRQLGRRLGVELGFAYTRNVPIVTSQTIRTYSGRLQFNYRITNNYGIYAGYARDENTSLGGNTSVFANRVWISFSYGFSRPLGR